MEEKRLTIQASCPEPSVDKPHASQKRRRLSPKAALLLAVLFMIAFTAGYRYGLFVSSSGQDKMLVGNGVQIAVHVKGAVEVPGVYLFTPEQRVADAVRAAGPLPDADLNQLNLAAYLVDGSQVLVPYLQSTATDPSPENNNEKVNINTATAEELDTLPGIGEQKAAAIIRYREQNGAFSSIEELSLVSGISDTMVEEIRDLICTE